MKISVFTDTSVVGFYGYIKKYQWKLWQKNIGEQKLIKTHGMLGKTPKNDRKDNNTYIEVVLRKKFIYV